MAAFWFRKAAEQGDDEAQLHLADILRSGDGLKPDYEEALKWYGKIVEQESTFRKIAEDRLGDMYAGGEGVPKDYVEAAKWWEKPQNTDGRGGTIGSESYTQQGMKVCRKTIMKLIFDYTSLRQARAWE
jgi:hypothetical protein